MISHHLKDIGVERLAVATLQEGIHLRKHGVYGPIHVFGECTLYCILGSHAVFDEWTYLLEMLSAFKILTQPHIVMDPFCNQRKPYFS